MLLYNRWCVNKLSINIEKTSYIIFRKRKSSFSTDIYNWQSCYYKDKHNTNFGVFILMKDWLGKHKLILFLPSYMIYKASQILNDISLKTLYYSLYYSHLDYCSKVWSNTYHSNLKCLVTLQKQVIRTMSHNGYYVPTNNIFCGLNILKKFWML